MNQNPSSKTSFFSTALAFGITIALVLSVYAWAAHGSNRENFSASHPNGFYAWLTEAFLAGQTHIKVEPDPAIKKLADPWLDGPWLPRLHDATYFRGHYYIYFGPGAVVVLLAPWWVLTGTYLSDGGATAILVAAAFLLGCVLLWRIWWRWFASSLPAGWLVSGALFWGLGNYLCVLLGQATFYFVPIAFAHVMCLGALLAIWQALGSTAWRRAVGWFSLSCFLWAAALSGRPNYLLSLPVLFFAFLRLRAMATGTFGRRSGTATLLAAGAIPIAAMGVTLAAYNWVRYGMLTEFGVHYQFAMGDQRQTKLFEWVHFVPNIKWYLFSSPDLSPYFPFTNDIESGWGLVFCGPLMLLALLFPISLRRDGLRADPLWRTLVLTLAAAAVLNFISLLGVPWANERYFGDFVPLMTLLALATLWFLARAAAPQRAQRVGLRIAVGALAGWTLACSAIFIVARYPHYDAIASVRRFAIRLVDRIEQLRHVGHGALTLQVTFGEVRAGVTEPLVLTGHGHDLVFVRYLENNRVQFGFFHTGNPAVFGAPVEIKRGTPYSVMVNVGAFYPPPEHPVMAGWSAAQIETLKSTVVVRLDQAEVLRTHSVFYPSHPDDVRIGLDPGGLVGTKKFSGAIKAAGPRTMPTPADLAVHREEGPVKLSLTLPPFAVFRSEPLVSTGRRGSGDIVFISYIAKGRIRFGHDSTTHGAVTSETVDYDPAQTHEIEIDMGSLRSIAAPVQAPLIVRFNGRTVLDEQRFFNPSSGDQVVFGFNGMGSSIVAEAFAGDIHAVKTVGPLPRTSLFAQTESHGAIRLVLKFPVDATGQSEPLLVTGRTGKGDVVYVTYLDETRVKFGVDHWGVGACSSEPVTVDREKEHTLDISIGSLFPDESDPWWNSTPLSEQRRRHTQVILQLDGATIIDQSQRAHPSKLEEVAVGTNPIGASTCGPTFRGKILRASRLPP